ncbi:IS5 family transposase [Streptomyces wuyuanensis]|uniref:IS5 family transposase n=1 Tax=Streptomyces wuyuanensis TaxID=1196353 RepID=UPI003829EA36
MTPIVPPVTVSTVGGEPQTSEQWARLEPLLPAGKKPGRLPVWSKRQLINGIRWRMRTGAPWRDVPPRYGEWETVYGLFRRWQRDGTWSRILTQLQAEVDAKGLITWDVWALTPPSRELFSTPTELAKGDLQRDKPGGVAVEPADHGLGRSRGGLTAKVHLAVEHGQKPLSFLVTAGHRHDRPQFQPVLERIRVPRAGVGRPRRRPDRVRAD